MYTSSLQIFVRFRIETPHYCDVSTKIRCKVKIFAEKRMEKARFLEHGKVLEIHYLRGFED